MHCTQDGNAEMQAIHYCCSQCLWLLVAVADCERKLPEDLLDLVAVVCHLATLCMLSAGVACCAIYSSRLGLAVGAGRTVMTEAGSKLREKQCPSLSRMHASNAAERCAVSPQVSHIHQDRR
jgi:hypothetical protein